MIRKTFTFCRITACFVCYDVCVNYDAYESVSRSEESVSLSRMPLSWQPSLARDYIDSPPIKNRWSAHTTSSRSCSPFNDRPSIRWLMFFALVYADSRHRLREHDEFFERTGDHDATTDWQTDGTRTGCGVGGRRGRRRSATASGFDRPRRSESISIDAVGCTYKRASKRAVPAAVSTDLGRAVKQTSPTAGLRRRSSTATGRIESTRASIVAWTRRGGYRKTASRPALA